jgi:hypothetical protein
MRMERLRTRRRSGQRLVCGWCGQPIALRPTGRLPKWCSPTCRHRAWEQRRAARSGLAAIEVVDRIVEVEKEVIVVQPIERPPTTARASWHTVLAQVNRQVETGRVRDRDLPELHDAIENLLTAFSRRPSWQRLIHRRELPPQRWSSRPPSN